MLAPPLPPLLALLVAGHVLGELLPRTWAPVGAPPRRDARHALGVTALEAALVLPFAPSLVGLVLLAGLAAVHAGLHRGRADLERRAPRAALWWMLLDHALQLVALAAAWALWPDPPTGGAAATAAGLALVAAAVVFNGHGGSAIVVATLGDLGTPARPGGGASDDGPAGAGKRIGVLERWIVLGLVAMGEWGAVGLVLTAKSVARFKRMEEQSFAEVYLVGTMTSVLVAMGSGVALRLALGL